MSNAQGSHRAARGGRRGARGHRDTQEPQQSQQSQAPQEPQQSLASQAPQERRQSPESQRSQRSQRFQESREAGAIPGGSAAVPERPRTELRRLLPKALPRVLPKALVVAFLAGGTSAFAGEIAEPPTDEEVAVGTHDIVAPAPGTALVTAMRAEGAHLSASRSSVRRDSLPADPAGDRVSEEAIPYDTVRTEDPSVFRGTEVVDQQGSPGARRVTYGLRTVDGVKQEPHRVHEEVVRAPVTQRVRVGTKELPRTAAGVDDLNWKALAACESGGRPNVVDRSGTYGGLYQFDTATWRSVGGKGRPQDASEAEQTYRAKKLYMQRGASPWPHCGRRLTG
ncbi:transglycosylase family protein [Streptomyces sp. NPDC059396]|uniref:resuscitation-promoting factor n=1 Tax=Streptomyces sp. NPDC059396 TaxID=3346819 RepID=UPI0036836B6B